MARWAGACRRTLTLDAHLLLLIAGSADAVDVMIFQHGKQREWPSESIGVQKHPPSSLAAMLACRLVGQWNKHGQPCEACDGQNQHVGR